ncbi:MAG: zinc ribbon domain-containing protein [Candidatus Heimdallarchaeaceae archaeon]
MNKSSKYCTECGREHKKESKFCKDCGKPLKDVDTNQPPQKTADSKEPRLIDIIARSLAKSPYPIIFTAKEFTTFFNEELGEKKFPGMALGDFYKIDIQFNNFFDNQLEYLPEIEKMMKSSDITGEIKKLESFWNQFSRYLMREIMQSSRMGQPVSFGSEESRNKFVSVIIYFIQKYPELIDVEAFAKLSTSKQDNLRSIASVLDSIIYRFNKDINCENEPMPEFDKYITYNIQKFMMSISLKLPNDKTSYTEEQTGTFLRHAFNLYRYQVNRTKLDMSIIFLNPNDIITIAEYVKAAETLLDLLVDLNNIKIKTKRVYESEVKACVQLLIELFNSQKMYTIRHHQLVLRWIEDTISSIYNTPSPSKLDYSMAVKPFVVLISLAGAKVFENDRYKPITDQIYAKSVILFKDIISTHMFEIFSELQHRYVEVAMMFTFLAYQFRDNNDALVDLLKPCIVNYYDRIGMHTKITFLMRNAVAKASEDFEKPDLRHVADSIDFVIRPLNPISDNMIVKLEDLSQFEFQDGNFTLEEYTEKTYTILGDQEITSDSNIVFSSIKSNTDSQTLSIEEGALFKLLNNLPFTTEKAGSMIYNMEDQIFFRGSSIFALLTVDDENRVDGLLFILEIETEEIESHTTIYYPGGSREGVPRKMKMPKIKSVHLKGIADTDGPLGTGKISLEKYLEKIRDNEKFVKAKKYYMKIEEEDFPLLSSLVF